jgi:AraC-like DNA-binding protein
VLSEYQLLFISRGEGVFESQRGGKKRILAGNVILTFPDDWHRYRPVLDTGWDQYWVGFRGSIADGILSRGILRPDSPVLTVGKNPLILGSFDRLLQRLREEPPGYQQMMAGNILEMLGAATAAARLGRQPDAADDLVQRAKLLLDPSAESVMTVEEVAGEVGFSGAHFRRICKRHTGMSPYQYALHLRINRAREMLHSTGLPIRQIAAQLGFDNPYHFSAAFKRKTGVSPTQWRHGGKVE